MCYANLFDSRGTPTFVCRIASLNNLHSIRRLEINQGMIANTAEMLVYGSYNALNQTLRQLYAEETSASADHPHRTVSYKTFKGNWSVVSGIEEGRVFYQKMMLTKAIFKTFRIEYNESQKDLYDPLTAQMARSFRGWIHIGNLD